MSGKILVIASRFNEFVTSHLVKGAEETLQDAQGEGISFSTVWVPGAFELPSAAQRAARTKAWDAIVCLGAVIRGETPHFDYVCEQAAQGIMQVSLETGTPVIFGVLTTDNIEQALQRCGIKSGNKGRESAAAALAMIKSFGRIDRLAQERR